MAGTHFINSQREFPLHGEKRNPREKQFTLFFVFLEKT